MKMLRYMNYGSLFALAASLLLSYPQAAQAAIRNAVCSGASSPADGNPDYASIAAALSGLTKNVTNTIRVLGTCTEQVQINDYHGLTIQGHPSATLAEIALPVSTCGAPPVAGGNANVVTFSNSDNGGLAGLTITGGRGVTLLNSFLNFGGLKVQSSIGDGITVNNASRLTLAGSGPAAIGPSLITGNCGSGVNITLGSRLDMQGTNDVTGNGFAGLLTNGALNIFGSGGVIHIANNSFGIGVNPGSSTSVLGTPGSSIFIEDSDHFGVNATLGAAITLSGNVTVQNNMKAPSSAVALAHPAAIYADYGAILAILPGVQVRNNSGAGIAANTQGIVKLGNYNATTAVTVAGNSGGGLVLTHNSIAEIFTGNTLSGNTGSDASCDVNSTMVGDIGGIAILRCAKVNK